MPNSSRSTARGCLGAVVIALVAVPASCYAIDAYAVRGDDATGRAVEEVHASLLALQPEVPLPPGARPADDGTGRVMLAPVDAEDAAVAHRIARWPGSLFVEFFICGDSCPLWTPDDPVTLSANYDIDPQPRDAACDAQLAALRQWAPDVEAPAPDPDLPGIACEFSATTGDAEVIVELRVTGSSVARARLEIAMPLEQ